MCLTIRKRDKKKTAEDDIPCWKVLDVEAGKEESHTVYSIYFPMEWDLSGDRVWTAKRKLPSAHSDADMLAMRKKVGKIQADHDDVVTLITRHKVNQFNNAIDQELADVHDGFHSYVSASSASRDQAFLGDSYRTRVQFYIPKGTEYYTNGVEYVSVRIGYRRNT